MKWYFALNAASIEVDKMYVNCVEVAVLSALQHTSLHPHLLFDGLPCTFTERLKRMGVTILHHRSSLSRTIIETKPEEPAWQRIAHGAFLRIDIPLIDTVSEFVLYTDCDVMFLREPKLVDIRPAFFAVAPEFTLGDYINMNSGVMVINVPGMRSVHQDLDRFIRGGLAEFAAFDQGALRQFFEGRYEPLPERMNWKPYWGSNPEADIVHFHGPKPPQAREMLRGLLEKFPRILTDLYLSNTANYATLDELWHTYLKRAQSH